MNNILTEEQTQDYFKKLDNYFIKGENKTKKKKCCENQKLYKDNYGYTCSKCGKVLKDNYDVIEPKVYLNQRFHNCTLINNCVKFKNIRKLQKWSNYHYKEVVMEKSFQRIKDICQILDLNQKIINGSKIKYKEIFIDLKISSRSNIRKAMYIYCIYFSCKYYNVDINIEDLIKVSEINKIHYNKVLRKLEKKNIIHSEKKINKILKICKNNNITIEKEKLINNYNNFKLKKVKLNNNSIIIGVLFDMLDIKRKDFIKIFKTTKITLIKYNKFKDLL